MVDRPAAVYLSYQLSVAWAGPGEGECLECELQGWLRQLTSKMRPLDT